MTALLIGTAVIAWRSRVLAEFLPATVGIAATAPQEPLDFKGRTSQFDSGVELEDGTSAEGA